MRDQVVRCGDMHHNRSLRVVVEKSGDVILIIEQNGMPIGGMDTGQTDELCAQVEFCTSTGAGRSPRTRLKLLELIEAMKQDAEEYPVTPQ